MNRKTHFSHSEEPQVALLDTNDNIKTLKQSKCNVKLPLIYQN